MDVNGTPFLLLRDASELGRLPRELRFSPYTGRLCLAPADALRLPARNVLAARAFAGSATVLDGYGQQARIASDGGSLLVTLPDRPSDQALDVVRDDAGEPLAPRAGATFRELAARGTRLALLEASVSGQSVLVFDLRQRWQERVSLPHACERLCVDADGAVWCLGAQALLRLRGGPLPHPFESQSGRFGPEQVNPTPLQIDLQLALPPGSSVHGLCADDTRVHALVARADDHQLLLVWRRATPTTFELARIPPELPFFTDVAALAGDRLALLAPIAAADRAARHADVAVVALELEAETVRLLGERFPTRDSEGGRFVCSTDGVLRYRAGDVLTPLVALPLPRYERTGSWSLNDGSTVFTPRCLDGKVARCVWHRLYLEARIPANCAIRIFARADDTLAQVSNAEWVEQPRCVWQPFVSELPWHECTVEREPGRAGLFETLLQWPHGNVRRLEGRFLQLRYLFEGDGRNTPELACTRVYARRFSYQESYLPSLFRQREERSDEQALANGADVRERYFATFESTLTELEGRVAHSELLLDPQTAPARALPALARLIATQPDAAWPLARKRNWIGASGALQREHGTLRGVLRALDLATDGAVRRGELVVLENWRLRRTMVTLLGVEIDDALHPLTLGSLRGGNSIVGDSLILGEDAVRSYVALLDPSFTERDGLQQLVQRFFEQFAHTVSVLLHGPARRQRALVEQMLPRVMPATVAWQVIPTEHSFVLGLSPLLALDTYLEAQPEPRPVVLDDTYLQREGLLDNPPALIPYAAMPEGETP